MGVPACLSDSPPIRLRIEDEQCRLVAVLMPIAPPISCPKLYAANASLSASEEPLTCSASAQPPTSTKDKFRLLAIVISECTACFRAGPHRGHAAIALLKIERRKK